ncbi:MAG: hypothetical protein ABI432_00075 [Flavobacteriales bacterium]
MNKFLTTLALALVATWVSAQTQVYDYISVDYSPAVRQLAVFSTLEGTSMTNLKVVNMDERDKDILVFFHKLQELEQKGWEVEATHIYSTDEKNIPMYVWILRKPKP